MTVRLTEEVTCCDRAELVVTEQRGKEGGRQSSSQWLVAKNEERNWKKEDGSWCSLGLGHPLSSNEASSFFRQLPTNQPFHNIDNTELGFLGPWD